MNNTPTRPNRQNTKLAYQEKWEEREAWHKLVVKIISWKSGLVKGGMVTKDHKITAEEWKTYFDRTLQINTTYGRQRVLSDLEETRTRISNHGGFADEVS